MSGKRAKLNRKEAEKPICEVTITIMSSGRVNVNGFPKKWDEAKGVLDAGMSVMSRWFINHAKDGNLDDDLRLIESSIILPDEKKIIMPGSVH